MLIAGAALSQFPDDNLEELRSRMTARVEDLIPKVMAELFESVETRLHPKCAIVVEYPVGMFTDFDANGNVRVEAGCGFFDSWLELDIPQVDAEVIQDIGRLLNARIQHEVLSRDSRNRRVPGATRWVYVGGIADAFRGAWILRCRRVFCRRDRVVPTAR